MSERGSVALWMLGLTVMVIFMGGIALDLWRTFEVRVDLSAMADSAAVAAASQLDTPHYRATGDIILDRSAAIDVAESSLISQQDFPRITARPEIDVDGPNVFVILEGEVEFTLLKIFLGGDGLTVKATGTATALQAP